MCNQKFVLFPHSAKVLHLVAVTVAIVRFAFCPYRHCCFIELSVAVILGENGRQRVFLHSVTMTCISAALTEIADPTNNWVGHELDRSRMYN